MTKNGLRWRRTEYFEPSSFTERFGVPSLIAIVLAAGGALSLDLGPLFSSALAAVAAVFVALAGVEFFFPGRIFRQTPACTLGADGIQLPDGRFLPWPQIRYVEPEQLPAAGVEHAGDTIVIGVAESPVRVRVSDPMAFIYDASQRRAYHNSLQDENDVFKGESRGGYRVGEKRRNETLVRIALDVSKSHDHRLDAYARLDPVERETLVESLADDSFRESLEEVH